MDFAFTTKMQEWESDCFDMYFCVPYTHLSHTRFCAEFTMDLNMSDHLCIITRQTVIHSNYVILSHVKNYFMTSQ